MIHAVKLKNGHDENIPNNMFQFLTDLFFYCLLILVAFCKIITDKALKRHEGRLFTLHQINEADVMFTVILKLTYRSISKKCVGKQNALEHFLTAVTIHITIRVMNIAEQTCFLTGSTYSIDNGFRVWIHTNIEIQW